MALGKVNDVYDSNVGKISDFSSSNIGKILGTDFSSGGELILDEDCSSLSGWGLDVPDTVTVDPAGQYQFLTTTTLPGNIHKLLASPPTQFTFEIRLYLDRLETEFLVPGYPWLNISYQAANWVMAMTFSSDGLRILDSSSYTLFSNATVLCNSNAAWQTWRFQIDRSSGDSDATLEVFLDGVSKGTADSNNLQEATEWTPDGTYIVTLNADDFNNMNTYLSHIDYMKIKDGLGAF